MNPRKRPIGRYALAGLLAVSMAAGATGHVHAAEPLVLDHGHIDAFHVAVENGEVILDLTEDVTGSHVRHAPEDVLLHVREEAWIDGIPPAYPGSPAGYVLPLTQNPDLIWPGWDTNGTAGSGYTDVEIEITSVNGPGDVHLYTLSGFGAVTSLLEEGGYQLPGTLREETPAHTHAQWTFTEAGQYTLTAQATATNPNTGESRTSNTATYTFAVGDLEEPAPDPTSLAIEGLAERYHTGDAVELTAVPDVETELGSYHWYTRDSADGQWEAAEGGEGARYRGTAQHDGQQIRAELLGEDGEVVVASGAVTVRVNDEEPGGGGNAASGAGGSGDDGGAGGDSGGSSGDGGPQGGDSGGSSGDGGPQGGGSAGGDDSAGGSAGAGSGGNGSAAGGDVPPECLPVDGEQTEREREAPAPDQPDETDAALVLDHGHIDAFNVTVEAGELSLDLKEDVTGSHVRHAPEDVVLHVKPEALSDEIPSAYPGSPSGYLLPLTQDPDLIWPGWDTNGTAGSGYTDVEIEITSATGPGEVFLYSTNTFGGAVPLLEGGDYQLPGTLREETPAHTHAQWTFTEAGQYTLTAQATATNPNTGESRTSNTATYTFTVGEAPGGAEPQGGTTTRVVTTGKTATGEDCELSGDRPAGGNLATTGSSAPSPLVWISAALLALGTAVFAVSRRRGTARTRNISA